MILKRVFSTKNKLKRKKSLKKNNPHKGNLILMGIVFFIIILIFSLITPVFVALLEFNPKSHYNDGTVTKWDYRSKFKILLIGVDRKGGEHVFVDGLSVLIVDPSYNQVGIINVSPDIQVFDKSIDKNITLRRGLIDSKSDILTLTEDLLATEIDRYLIVDKVYLDKMQRYSKTIEVEIKVGIDDPDVTKNNTNAFWSKGSNSLRPEHFYDYLRSDNDGETSQLQRQLELYSHYTQSIDVGRLLLGSKDLFNMVEENVDTNLLKNEIFYLYYFLRRVPPVSYNLAVTESDILTEVGQAGVYKVFRANDAQLDNITNGILENKDTVLEQTTVEVLNASGESGIGRQLSRWLGNTGLEVIHVGNAPFSSDETLVHAPAMIEYPFSIRDIKMVLGDNVRIVDEEYDYRHIGKVVIVIGKN